MQFWLRSGEQSVFFDLGNDPPVDSISAAFGSFLRAVGRGGGDAGEGVRNGKIRYRRNVLIPGRGSVIERAKGFSHLG